MTEVPIIGAYRRPSIDAGATIASSMQSILMGSNETAKNGAGITARNHLLETGHEVELPISRVGSI